MPRDLSRLMRPASIAVVGGGWGLAVVEQCLKMGFAGEIWPVHPTRDEVHGLPCYRNIADLPGAPDATFIGVNRHLTIETVAALSAMGAGGAVCFASGFAEAEDDRDAGAGLQADLLAAAGDMPILGPNCYGLINYLDGALLWPDQHGGARVESGVAILTQSSNLLINITMQRRGLPMAYALTAGNQAQTGLADLAMAVLEDPRVTAVGLHIEGVGDVRAFEAMAARARELKKPVVAMKVGKSEQAQAATLSHTASLAGSDAASRAFLKRLNIPVMDTLPGFLETLKLLHVHGALPGRSLCSMSCSGGEASLIADAAEGRRVSFRALSEPEHDRVKATLSDLVAVANPLDYHTFIWGDAARMQATYAAMLGCGFDLGLLVYDFPRLDRCSDAAWECGIEALCGAAEETGARAAMVASLPENLPEDRVGELIAAGIAPMMGLEEALTAAEAAADIAEGWASNQPAPVVLGVSTDAATVLTEDAAKALLADHGIRVPKGMRVETAAEAGNAAASIGGRVVLKGLGLAHKTEAGAVKLGLSGAAEVEAAAAEMAGVDGWLVEEMIDGAVAELIVGVVRDPVYGLVLTIGAGGVLTELLRDSASLLIPSAEAEVSAALDGLRIAPLLAGYRGAKPADRGALLATIMAIQDFALANADRLQEMDINPLLVTPGAAIAVDALIRMGVPD
ncbi:MAG: acetate--CoA ligase family protein [Pseudomonadota bacterium]